MFKNIEYAKSVVVSHAIAQPMAWTHIINNMPSLPPDEVVIRSITYNADPLLTEDVSFMIWSSLNHDFIGAFSGFSGSGTHNPQSRITLNGSFLGNTISFSIYEPGVNGPHASLNSDMPGDLIICMDFIRYIR